MNLLSVTAPGVIPTLRATNPTSYDYQRSLFLYDSISLRMARKDSNGNLLQNVPLHRDFLCSILGTDYLKIVDNMIEAGIIGRSESYQVDKYAKGYWINDDYLLSATDKSIYRTITNDKIIHRFNKYYRERSYNQLLYSPKFSHLQSNFDALSIDTDQVDEWLINNYDESVHDKRRTHIYKHSVGKLVNQSIQFKRSQNGRLHSALTTLKKELRPFLFDRQDGAFDFVEIDIANCQLCMLCFYLLYNYPEVKNKRDFATWGKLCMKGEIYDHISKRIGYSRDQVKQCFMKAFLYTSNNKSWLLKSKTKLSDEQYEWRNFLMFMKSDFPTIWNKVYGIKKTIGKSQFAVDLQRMESKLMIDNVLSKTKKFGTHFTIHDSLVCRTEDKAHAIELINNQSKKLFKIELPLKDKSLYEK